MIEQTHIELKTHSLLVDWIVFSAGAVGDARRVVDVEGPTGRLCVSLGGGPFALNASRVSYHAHQLSRIGLKESGL